MTELERYARAWREYRFRALRFIAVLASAPAVFVIGAELVQHVVPQRAQFVTLDALLVLCIGAAIGSTFALRGWPCPRCGKPYFGSFLRHNPFARRCQSCDLPLGARSG